METTLHNDHKRHHISPKHGLYIAECYHGNGLRMHMFKVYHMGLPTLLLSQFCNMEDAEKSARAIMRAIDDGITR